MLDVIVRKDGERTLARQVSIQQRLAYRADLCERLAIRKPAPFPRLVALRNEAAVGRHTRPMEQLVSKANRIWTERVRGAQQHRTVGPTLDVHVCRSQPDSA